MRHFLQCADEHRPPRGFHVCENRRVRHCLLQLCAHIPAQEVTDADETAPVEGDLLRNRPVPLAILSEQILRHEKQHRDQPFNHELQQIRSALAGSQMPPGHFRVLCCVSTLQDVFGQLRKGSAWAVEAILIVLLLEISFERRGRTSLRRYSELACPLLFIRLARPSVGRL